MPKITHKKLSARQREMEEVFFEIEYQLFICQSIYGVVFCLFNNEGEFRTFGFGRDKKEFLCCLCFTLLLRICLGLNCFFQ